MQKIIPIPNTIAGKGLNLKNKALMSYIYLFEPNGSRGIAISLTRLELDEFPLDKRVENIASKCTFCFITGYSLIDFLWVFGSAKKVALRECIEI